MIKITKTQSTLRLSFNRPHKKNSLTLQSYQQLTKALDRAEQDKTIKSVIFEGEGGCFTAGNDIHDFLGSSQDFDLHHPAALFLLALNNFSKPLIAVVDGLAIGIGTTLLLHCDFVYVTPTASFQLPFINLGLTPEACSSLLLPQRIGWIKAMELFLLGHSFTGERAYKMGLVTEIVAASDLIEKALQTAQILASKPLEALIETKKLLKYPSHKQREHIITHELDVFAKRLKSPEAQKAFTSFLKET